MLTARHLLLLTVLATFTTLGLSSKSAFATTPISLDLDYALPVDAGPVSDGFGAALRFGPRLDLKIITMTAEAGLGAHDFSGPEGPTVYRGVIGTRFGLGILLRPSVYGHIGVGHVDWAATDDLTHLTLDGGVALDLTLAPVLELGVHAAYNFVPGNGSVGSFGFMAIGGHLTIILDGD